jgi:hypothetical protein
MTRVRAFLRQVAFTALAAMAHKLPRQAIVLNAMITTSSTR